jgi:hypothetical protein
MPAERQVEARGSAARERRGDRVVDSVDMVSFLQKATLENRRRNECKRGEANPTALSRRFYRRKSNPAKH